MDFFNTSFYDKASVDYSKRRYNTLPHSFIQFFFQARLKHVLSLVRRWNTKQDNRTLIEDGCADGIVIQAIKKAYPTSFSRLVGTDISPGMIQTAQIKNKDSGISFVLKSELDQELKVGTFLAVGFVSPGIFEDEFSFIRSHVVENGIIILSLAARNSPYARLKLSSREITGDYWTFKKYEEFLRKDFEIIDKVPYGLFVPKLWAIPRLARIIQPALEILLRPFQILFHETLYVLKYKR